MIMSGVLTRRKNDLTKVDLIVYTLLTVFFIINLLTFDYSGAHWAVILTFFLLGAFFYFRIITARKNISLYRVYYIFCFVFMFYAPLQQYLSHTVFQTNNGWTLTYNDADYLRANAILFAFTVLFELGYHLTKQKVPRAKPVTEVPTVELHMTLLFCSFIAIGVLVATGNLFGREGYDVSNVKIGSQINNILHFFPAACFVVTVLQNRNTAHKQKWVSAIFLLETIFVFFPFYGSIPRFLIFGVYCIMISLFFSQAKHQSLYFLLYVIGFFFVFSSFNYFKSHSFGDLSGFALSLTNFKTMDYDAYQMLMATVSYVDANGCVVGKNILSAILNFVPRSIWSSKMLPSGQIVADYYGTWFTNVSCPVMAECYFAFGFFGILLGAPLTGFVLKKIDGFDRSESMFKKGFYFLVSGLLIYILRGAMLPTFAYTFALILSLTLVCVLTGVISARTKSRQAKTQEDHISLEQYAKDN